MSDLKIEAQKILDYWDQYLHNIGFKSDYLSNKINAHKEIKALITEPFTNKDLVIEMSKDHDFFYITNVKILDFCSDEIKNDRQAILDILAEYGENLALLSPELQDDKEIVMVAVESSGSLEYASEKLRDDDDVVLLSLVIYPDSLEFASKRFQNNKELVLELVKRNHYMLEKVNDEMKNDPTFLSEYWYHVKENSFSLGVSADSYIFNILQNMGDKLKPIFANLNLKDPSKKLVSEFETYLTQAALNKELGTSTKKEKRPKL